jgi:hypothetical protein
MRPAACFYAQQSDPDRNTQFRRCWDEEWPPDKKRRPAPYHTGSRPLVKIIQPHGRDYNKNQNKSEALRAAEALFRGGLR